MPSGVYIRTEEHKQKIKNALILLGENNPSKRPEVREKLRKILLGNNNGKGNKGKHHSEETKRKIGNAFKGKKQSQEMIEKRRKKLIGKKRTNKTKKKMSLAQKGRKHTNETKQKIEALLERRLQTIVMRKNLALTAKQARQFITHGKIAVNGKKASTPSHIVPKDQESTVAYYKEPMKLLSPEQEKKGKKDLKKEFEESAATEETIEKIIEEKPEGEK